MDIFVDMLRMADIFAEKPQLNAKTQAKAQKQQQDETMKNQILCQRTQTQWNGRFHLI